MNARRLTVGAIALLCAAAGVLTLASGLALAAKEFVPVGTFGSEGAGEGQFRQPTGVAVNDSSEPLIEPAAGDVYVADLEHSRIERFSPEGAYISQFNGSETPQKELTEPRLIAVDDSENPLDPAGGNVYVASSGYVDEFSATGVYKDRLRGTCENEEESAVEPSVCPGSKTKEVIPFGSMNGVAVDRLGNLWVYTENESSRGQVDEFSDTGSFLKTFNTENFVREGIAVDSAGNVYVASNEGRVLKFEGATGKKLAELSEVEERPTALAIDPSTNNLLVDKRSSVALYTPSGELLETFSGEGLSESEGIAMSSAGAAYVTQRQADDVEIFDYASLPAASTGQALGVSETAATLQGTMNPRGEAVSECRFEYGTEASYGHSVQCVQTPAQIGTGTGAVAVSAELSGLQSRTTYHFDLVGVNANGTRRGRDETLYTFGHPLVEDESVASVGSTEASISAQINASGLPTTYRVEYGTSEAYGSSTPEVNLGASQNAAGVLIRLSGLQPGTGYHFKVLATNSFGTLKSSDETLTTAASAGSGSSALPDNRAYELVSSPSSNANVQPPLGELETPNGTATLVRAATGGDAVIYEGDPPAEGGAGDTGDDAGNAYIATRGAHGWTQTDLQLSSGSKYEGFSSDLSVGVMDPELFGTAAEHLPIPSSAPPAPSNCNLFGQAGAVPLFTRTSGDGAYHALLSTTPTQASTYCAGEFAGANQGTVAVAQYSHILFQSEAALTSEAIGGLSYGQGFNLYDSVDGTVHLVSVLPDGKPTTSAVFGNANLNGEQFSSGNGSPYDISADGSRVFWSEETEVAEEHYRNEYHPSALYVRENDTQPQSPIVGSSCAVADDACTVQLDVAQEGAEGQSGGGLFQSASSDGSQVFFTDKHRLTIGSTAAPGEPDLYEYTVNAEAGRPGTLADLTVDEHAGEHANVQGVMGTSEDGSYIYFVADGVLTVGENAEGHEPAAGQPNLYVHHDGVTTFIAQAGNESQPWEPVDQGGNVGNLMVDARIRTAEATADGHSLVFRSRMKLTGYENLGLPEVFVYDSDSGRLSCASCDPTGAPPTENLASTGTNGRLYGDGASLPISSNSDFMLRWISDDGSRVFFVTGQPLVSQDVNGLQDVYEWERVSGSAASGSETNNSCTRSSSSFSEVSDGCVYLLSGGTSTDNSYFLDASANGDDVFIRTRARLAPQASGETMALYDARVDGGFPEPSFACTGTGCQGVPPAPPIFATPSSVTFSGVGNFPPSVPAKKTTKKKIAKCAKGKQRSHGKCVKKKTAKMEKKKAKKIVRKRSNRNGRKS